MTSESVTLCRQLPKIVRDGTTVATTTTANVALAVMVALMAIATAGAATHASAAAATSVHSTATTAELEHKPKLAEVDSCSFGCSLCSDINGCLQCKSAYYLILVRDYMLHRGVCSQTCPSGYYPSDQDASAGPLAEIKKCLRCNLRNCEMCYNRQFCNRCYQPYVIFKGQCYDMCPHESASANATTDCSHTECLTGPWSAWSACKSQHDGECSSAASQQNPSGTQSRSREVLRQSRAKSTAAKCVVQVREQQSCQLSNEGCHNSATETRTTSINGNGTARRDYKVHKRKIRPTAKLQVVCAEGAEGGPGNSCHHVRHRGSGSRSIKPALPSSQTKSVGSLEDLEKTSASQTDLTTTWHLSSRGLVTQKSPTTASTVSTNPLVVAHQTDSKPSPEEGRDRSISATAADVFSSDYYGYYLRLAKQVLRERADRRGS